MTSAIATRHRIRDLNDGFRQGGAASGQWMLTRGVVNLGPEFTALAVNAVRAFSGFTDDNDPYGEHDFGSLNVGGEHLFWKIDYYDPTLSFGSDDPGDPARTRRIITVMLASEY